MAYNYSFADFDKQSMSRAVAIAVPASVKHSVEVCNTIRHKKVAWAKKFLQDVLDMKRAVPYTRFNRDLGHKTKLGPGRFPIKTTSQIKQLLETAEANAQFQGLNTSNLSIHHIMVQKAPTAWHYGRQRRRKMKRATIEVVLIENKAEEKKAATPKKAKPSTQKKSSGESQ